MSNLWLRWVLGVFTVYRLARLLSKEEGPYLPLPGSTGQMGIFSWLRVQAGGYDYGPDQEPETNLGRGISCPFCTGVYMGFLVYWLIKWKSPFSNLILGWFGLSGLQAFLYHWTPVEEE